VRAANFDVLAAILFAEDYQVLKAALISREIVKAQATYVQYTNSHRFLLRDSVWTLPTVVNVSDILKTVEL